ncbi:MAG: UDP-N-acetylmuramate--L-alanine ligase, partial [Abditibacteriota bacterium]|nr:UDP-N-acetylmuramate--L-alanine ligase [Abditibacteriota bacterium]
DVYAAREKPIKGVDGNYVNKAILSSGFRNTSYMPKGDIAPHLKETVTEDDIVIVFGAGDINGICADLADKE